MKLALLFVSVLLLIYSAKCVQQQIISKRPANVTTPEGKTIELKCHIEGLVGPVQWAKDGWMLGIDKSLPGYPRYTMKVNEELGIFNLLINDTQIEDSGKYECQVGGNSVVAPVRASAHVVVSVPPRIVILRGPRRVMVNETTTFRCLTNPVHPPEGLQFNWSFGDHKVDMIRNFLNYSEATVTLKKEHNGQRIRCEAHHKLLMKPIIGIITVEVEYPPTELTVTIAKASMPSINFSSIKYVCDSSSSYPKAELIWSINNISAVNKHTSDTNYSSHSSLDLSGLVPGALVRCEAFWNGQKVLKRERIVTESDLQQLTNEEETDTLSIKSTLKTPQILMELPSNAEIIERLKSSKAELDEIYAKRAERMERSEAYKAKLEEIHAKRIATLEKSTSRKSETLWSSPLIWILLVIFIIRFIIFVAEEVSKNGLKK